MNKALYTIFIVTIMLFIQACDSGPKAGKGAGKYGMMDDNTPDFAAVAFFQHIYQDKKLTEALKLSTPRLAKVLKSYHTNRNVQRHVFNLTYDEVVIQPDTGNTVGRNEFAKSAVVTLFFSGTRNGERIEDIRVIEMVRENKTWLVDKVRADKYL